MNQIKEKINTDEAKCREFSPQELLGLLRMRLTWFMSWGCHAFVVDNKTKTRVFRMKVNGMLHKGHVYIFLNGADLFDVYLTTTHGKIVKRTEEMGLYFDQLSEWLDVEIERQSDYIN